MAAIWIFALYMCTSDSASRSAYGGKGHAELVDRYQAALASMAGTDVPGVQYQCIHTQAARQARYSIHVRPMAYAAYSATAESVIASSCCEIAHVSVDVVQSDNYLRAR